MATSHSLKLVVHLLAEHSSQLETQQRQDDNDLLSQGEALTHAGIRPGGWRSVKIILRSPQGPTDCPKNSYAFYTNPPVYEGLTSSASAKLRPWGDENPPLPWEAFSLDDLEPFQSTDVTNLFVNSTPCLLAHHPKTLSSDSSYTTKRPSAPPHSPPEPAAKRLKLEEDSLHSLIPLPHYHASPYTSAHPTHPAPGAEEVLFDAVPLPPHTSNTLNTILTSPYIRVAWIIPARGTPPWPGTSSASIATSNHSSPFPASRDPSTVTRNAILWTPASFQNFWAYLLHIISQSPSSLGLVACSFHAAPRPRAARHHPESESITYKSPSLNPTDPLPPAQDSSGRPTIDPPPAGALLSTDHIKVYCDAAYASAIHRLLVGWSSSAPAPAPAKGIDQGISLKHAAAGPLRVLENARLVLVDGKSAGLLVI